MQSSHTKRSGEEKHTNYPNKPTHAKFIIVRHRVPLRLNRLVKFHLIFYHGSEPEAECYLFCRICKLL